MNILIIGANSAVAQAAASRWAARGARMYWLARNSDKLQRRLAEFDGQVAGWQCFDFTEPGRAAAAVDAAFDRLGTIDIALIAHGQLPDQQASEHDIELVEKAVMDNLTSAIAFLLPLTRRMQQQGHGSIGVITSVAGDRGRPRNFTYAAAKGGLSIYLQGLRSALWHSGVAVYTFRLGPVDTPMTASHEKNFSFADSGRVADAIVQAFNHRRYDIYIPGFWRWVMLLVRHMPEWLFQRLKFLSAR